MGVGGGVPVLISTIRNFLDILGITTKSGEFSQNLVENKCCQGISCCHGNALSSNFDVILIFFSK